MRYYLIRILHPILRWYYNWWTRKPRHHRYKDLDLIVMPGVFHPGIFISTRLMVEYVETLDVKGKSFLELGAGAGLVALVAARNGANSTASDISEAAVKNLEENSRRTKIPLVAVKSDLFNELPQHFDIITVNPPYYPYEPKNEAEKAFFAGSDRQYFVRLFPELARRIASGTQVHMVLSDDLDHKPIDSLATDSGLKLVPMMSKVWLGEAQKVHRIVPQNDTLIATA